MEEGNFRQDLLYRINTIEITIPPLRERGEDVLLLADYFLQRYTHKYKKEINGLSREAKQKLMRYHWPGNVRELQHAIERAIILSDSPLLKPANFMLQSQPEKRVNTDEILNLYVINGGSSYSCIYLLSTFALFLLVFFADDYGRYYHLYLSVAV